MFGLLFAGLAWAQSISIQPYGIATPKWYGHSAGTIASYYLAAPTLAANDTAVGLAATQTLTNKTLTAPTITGASLATATLTAPVINGATGVGAAETVAATNVITSAECGKTFFLSHATEFASTLPTMATALAGCKMKFVVAAAPSGASYTVLTGNSKENLLIGGINELEVDHESDGPYIANGDTITFADGVSVVGDYVEIEASGAAWYVHGQANADGGITLTQAD